MNSFHVITNLNVQTVSNHVKIENSFEFKDESDVLISNQPKKRKRISEKQESVKCTECSINLEKVNNWIHWKMNTWPS